MASIKSAVLDRRLFYLSDLRFVQVNNSRSDNAGVKNGVPQGSVLGPCCIFALY